MAKTTGKTDSAPGNGGGRNLDAEQQAQALATEKMLELIADATTVQTEQLQKLESNLSIDTNLSAAQIRRLQGAGTKIYGFIDKIYDLVNDDDRYIPSTVNYRQMGKDLELLEAVRYLATENEAYGRLIHIIYLVVSNKLYTRDAVALYDYIKLLAKANDPMAEAMLKALAPFFKRIRKTTGNEPTEKQLNRDIHSLEHGKADGEIIIRNERPHVSGGVHEVIDNVE